MDVDTGAVTFNKTHSDERLDIGRETEIVTHLGVNPVQPELPGECDKVCKRVKLSV